MYTRKKIDHIIVTITIIWLVFLAVTISPTLYAQSEDGIQTKHIFVPLAELLYGPNNTEIITLTYRFAQVYIPVNNTNLVIHNPNFFTPSANVSHLPQGKTFIIVFDSYFLPNRQLQQIIPPVSDIEVSFVRILNPSEALDLTQMNLSSTIKIPSKATETGSFKFIIPPRMEPGDYLVNVFVLLDGKEVGAMYSTRIIVDQSRH